MYVNAVSTHVLGACCFDYSYFDSKTVISYNIVEQTWIVVVSVVVIHNTVKMLTAAVVHFDFGTYCDFVLNVDVDVLLCIDTVVLFVIVSNGLDRVGDIV